METNLLIIISFVAWLVPTILDTVIQINNALVVNHLAQTHIDENGRIGDIVIKLIDLHIFPSLSRWTALPYSPVLHSSKCFIRDNYRDIFYICSHHYYRSQSH